MGASASTPTFFPPRRPFLTDNVGVDADAPRARGLWRVSIARRRKGVAALATTAHHNKRMAPTKKALTQRVQQTPRIRRPVASSLLLRDGNPEIIPSLVLRPHPDSMSLRLTLENIDRLPDGGPVSVAVDGRGLDTVSYTHLTLPTNREV